MLLQLFLDTTDNFLCHSVKSAFAKAEDGYRQKDIKVDLKKELKKFEENPLGCMIGVDSKFETSIKLKIKLILGLFFVLIPILGFSAISYYLEISQTYVYLATFVVAIFVASRMDEISKRYVRTRYLEFTQ